LIEREIENKQIWFFAEKVKEEIHLSIEDNGGGIPFDVIGKIFDRDFSTKSKKNGTGLGLICQSDYRKETIIGKGFKLGLGFPKQVGTGGRPKFWGLIFNPNY